LLKFKSIFRLYRFKEAEIIQKKLELLVEEELKKWEKEKNEKIKTQSCKTAQKHLQEKAFLKRKVEIEYEVIKKEKDRLIENLNNKYKNRKMDLGLQHRKDVNFNENVNLLKASNIYLI
jgi:hypothetical protein